MDLLAIRRENAFKKNDKNGEPLSKASAPNGVNGHDDDKEATVPGTLITDDDSYKAAIASEKEPPDSVGGVLVQAIVDEDHWLGAGVARTLNVLVRGTDIYQPIRVDKGVNIARFAGADALLASGYMWQENREQLAYKPFVVAQPMDSGFVIGFTQDPTVRAYLDGLNVILMNAIFRAPGHARPVR